MGDAPVADEPASTPPTTVVRKDPVLPRKYRWAKWIVVLSIVALAMVGTYARPVVSEWQTPLTQGESAPLSLEAEVVYQLSLAGGCSNSGKFPASVEVVNATSRAVVYSSSAVVRSGSRSCALNADLGEFTVPDDGDYLVRWNITSAYAAYHPKFALRAPLMSTLQFWGLCGAGAFAAVAVAAASVKKRQILAAQSAEVLPVPTVRLAAPVPRIVEAPPDVEGSPAQVDHAPRPDDGNPQRPH